MLILRCLLCLAFLGGVLPACAHKKKQPKSGWAIIKEGERNPFITEDPSRAGEIERDRR